MKHLLNRQSVLRSSLLWKIIMENEMLFPSDNCIYVECQGYFVSWDFRTNCFPVSAGLPVFFLIRPRIVRSIFKKLRQDQAV